MIDPPAFGPVPLVAGERILSGTHCTRDHEALMPGTHDPIASAQMTIISRNQSVSVTERDIGGYTMLMTDLIKEHEFVEVGNIRDSQGRYEEALASYDNALRIVPEDADALFDKGETLEKMGRLQEAKKFYDLALSLYNGY